MKFLWVGVRDKKKTKSWVQESISVLQKHLSTCLRISALVEVNRTPRHMLKVKPIYYFPESHPELGLQWFLEQFQCIADQKINADFATLFWVRRSQSSSSSKDLLINELCAYRIWHLEEELTWNQVSSVSKQKLKVMDVGWELSVCSALQTYRRPCPYSESMGESKGPILPLLSLQVVLG